MSGQKKNTQVQQGTGQNTLAGQQKNGEPTPSERFLNKVKKEFAGSVGHNVEFTEHEKELASNLFIKVDAVLKEFEVKRQKEGRNEVAPYTWEHINLPRLAVDAVHRVRLGLDALIPNHIHPIPYFNGKQGLYDLDLRIGYSGKDYYRRQMSAKPVRNIVYRLVYENDHFKPIPKSGHNSIETYEYDIPQPFQRGKIEGGFGYIEYDNPEDNELVLVPESEFEKVSNEAKSNAFWGKWGDRMRYKTLVHRVTDKLPIDPRKVNTSFHYVEGQDSIYQNDTNTQARQAIDVNSPKKLEGKQQNKPEKGQDKEPEPVPEQQSDDDEPYSFN